MASTDMNITNKLNEVRSLTRRTENPLDPDRVVGDLRTTVVVPRKWNDADHNDEIITRSAAEELLRIACLKMVVSGSISANEAFEQARREIAEALSRVVIVNNDTNISRDKARAKLTPLSA
jgi:hypothetical protein